jgi:hypothetical protein
MKYSKTNLHGVCIIIFLFLFFNISPAFAQSTSTAKYGQMGISLNHSITAMSITEFYIRKKEENAWGKNYIQNGQHFSSYDKMTITLEQVFYEIKAIVSSYYNSKPFRDDTVTNDIVFIREDCITEIKVGTTMIDVFPLKRIEGL